MMMELNYTASFLIFYYPNKDKAMSCEGGKLRNIKRCSDAPLFDNRLSGRMCLPVGRVGKLISGKVLNHHSHSHHAIHEIIRSSLRSPVPPHLNRNLDGIQIDYFNSFKLIIKGIDYSIWDSQSVLALLAPIIDKGTKEPNGVDR